MATTTVKLPSDPSNPDFITKSTAGPCVEIGVHIPLPATITLPGIPTSFPPVDPLSWLIKIPEALLAASEELQLLLTKLQLLADLLPGVCVDVSLYVGNVKVGSQKFETPAIGLGVLAPLSK